MALPFEDKYKRQSDDIDHSMNPELKITDKNLYINKGQYLYSKYIAGGTFIPYAAATKFTELRTYSAGSQNNTKYMDIVSPKNKQNERKGWMNISWDNLPIYPKFRDILVGKILRFDYNTSVVCLDEGAEQERNMMKYEIFVNEIEKEYFQVIDELAGIDQFVQAPKTKLPVVPKTQQELDMFAQMGYFPLAEEVALEKLLEKSSRLSEWPEIRTKLAQDHVDLGMIAVKDYTDPVSQKPMLRYVDPANLIIDSSRDQSFAKTADVAEVVYYTLSELKDSGLSDEDIEACARLYQNTMGNTSYADVFRGGLVEGQLSAFRVAVLDMDFESFNTWTYEYRTVKSGQEVPFKLEYGDKGNKKLRKETNTYARRYRGKWVIGTTIAFDYGYQYDQVFGTDNRPKSSYSVYRTAERSITSRCISTVDDLQLAVLKFRNAWAKAKPSGVRVEWTSLSNMSLGTQKMQPMDILALYRDTGDLLWKASLENGRPVYGQLPPIEEMEGGIGRLLTEFMSTFAMYINTLRDISGLGQGQDASLPTGDTLVGNAKIAESATMDSMQLGLMGYKNVKSRAFNNLCLRWQLNASLCGVNEAFASSEGAALSVVKIGYNEGKKLMDVVCDMVIDDAQRADILQAANLSLQASKQGSAGIKMSDYAFIVDALDRGRLKWARMYLSYREEQEVQAQQERQDQNTMMQSKMAAEQEQLKTQGELAVLQEKIKIEDLKGKAAVADTVAKGEEDRKTLLLQAAIDRGQVDPLTMLMGMQQPPPPPVQEQPIQEVPQEQPMQEQMEQPTMQEAPIM
jgi:hypothetical protein